jgi:Ser/Thr protein kinase RdoA (MazF antagonist)/GNAT superfamily N-acetyltransferase
MNLIDLNGRQDEPAVLAVLELSHGSREALDEARAHYESGEWTFIGLRDANSVVACAGAEWFDSETIGIRSIAVAPEWRGQGLGRMLLGALTERFGTHRIVAETDDDAVDFYRRCGFTVEDAAPKFGRPRYWCTHGEESTYLRATMDDAKSGRRGLRATSSDALIETVCSAYGIDGGIESSDLGGSSNLNLLVGSGEHGFVIRVYRPYVTTYRLAAIQRVRDQLTKAGVPSGGLLQTLDGSRWMEFEGRLVEVEQHVAHNASMDSWDHLFAGLPILARLHDVMRTVEVPTTERDPAFANYIGSRDVVDQTRAGVSRMRSWDLSTDEANTARNAENLAKAVWSYERLFIDELPTQLVHGDFWDNNILFLNETPVFVTDFDYMGHRPRVDDLARTLFFTCMAFFELPVSDELLRRLRGLVDAYDANAAAARLTQLEREALPFAIARQPLWSIGGWVVWLDDPTAARRHAQAAHDEVEWALALVNDTGRWQDALT